MKCAQGLSNRFKIWGNIAKMYLPIPWQLAFVSAPLRSCSGLFLNIKTSARLYITMLDRRREKRARHWSENHQVGDLLLTSK